MNEIIQIYAQHCELPLLSVILIGLMLAHLSAVGGDTEHTASIKRLMYSGAFFAIVYGAWDVVCLREGADRNVFYAVNYIYNLAAYAMMCFFYECCFYTFRKKRRQARLAIRACHILFCLVSLAYWFTRDSELFVMFSGTPFDLGPMDALWYAVEYLPSIILIVHSLYSYYEKGHFSDREDHVKILQFSFIVGISAFIDQYLYEAHILLLGLTVGMIIFYFQSINSFISMDDLTGLYNRRKLFRDMEKRIGESRKWGIVLLDLNGFKKINDTYGHNEGDVALQSFAWVLKHACRGRNAKPYRFGGDEFVILKESWTGDVKKEIRELQSDVVRRLQLLDMKQHRGYTLTSAMGSAVWSKNDSISDILKRADEALYRQK